MHAFRETVNRNVHALIKPPTTRVLDNTMHPRTGVVFLYTLSV